MAVKQSVPSPGYLILTGPPCGGKSSLGRWLARELGLPFLERDVLAEIIFQELGGKDMAWRQKVMVASYRLFFSTMEMLFQLGRPFIVESTFHFHRDNKPVQRLQAKYGFTPFQIHCSANLVHLEEELRQRTMNRKRHPGWLDHKRNWNLFRKRVLGGVYDPLTLGGRLVNVHHIVSANHKAQLLADIRRAVAR